MTEDELIAAAEALAAQKIVVENHGMRNTPTDIRERVKADAAYMIARDKLRHLEFAYSEALYKFTQEEK